MEDLQVIERYGTRVLTTQQLAEAYGTDSERINRNFNRNRERYKKGKHFILLERGDLQEFRTTGQIDLSPNINKLYLWTEKGAWLHAKSLNTDEAWDAYETLVDDYYTKQQYKTPTSLKEALLLSVQLIEQNEKLESHNMELSQELSITKPKADYYDQILASNALVTTSTIAQDYGFRSPQALNNLLHEQEVQYKKSGQWFLYAKYKEEGYMHSHTYPDGRTHNKWTQKGRLFLHELLTGLGYKPSEVA